MIEKNYRNPYDVLGVSQTASNAEITKSFAMAMKHKEYSPEEIAKARKSLMNTEERIIADYLRPVLPTIKRFKSQSFEELDRADPLIELLSEFDELDELSNISKEISSIDKKIAGYLFS